MDQREDAGRQAVAECAFSIDRMARQYVRAYDAWQRAPKMGTQEKARKFRDALDRLTELSAMCERYRREAPGELERVEALLRKLDEREWERTT